MMGSGLAGTDESPGVVITKGGRKVKVVRGETAFRVFLRRNLLIIPV